MIRVGSIDSVSDVFIVKGLMPPNVRHDALLDEIALLKAALLTDTFGLPIYVSHDAKPPHAPVTKGALIASSRELSLNEKSCILAVISAHERESTDEIVKRIIDETNGGLCYVISPICDA